MHPNKPELHLPPEPMRRHHYLYGRNRYLIAPGVLEKLGDLHRTLAARQANEIGLLDPNGPGSFTHLTAAGCSTATAKSSLPSLRPSPETPAATRAPARSDPRAMNPTPGCTSREPARLLGEPSSSSSPPAVNPNTAG